MLPWMNGPFWTVPLAAYKETGAEVPDEELSSLSEQEIIRPKVNAKIVGKKRNFSFFIEPTYVLNI